MTKKDVIKLGRWPLEFLDNLVSDVPSVKTSGKTKLIWNCPEHGHYIQSIDGHLNGNRCPSCASKAAHRSRREKNPIPEWFYDGMHPDYINKVKNQEISLGSYIEWLCPEHGYYKQIGNHHMAGHNGCPICRKRIRAEASKRSKRESNPVPQWVLDEMTEESRDDLLSMRKTTNDDYEFICKKHGIYKQAFYAHVSMLTGERKCGCPSCGAENSIYGSKLELKLQNDLQNLGIFASKVRGIIKSPCSNLNMEIDLFIPKYSVGIEVNGLYYHSIEVMKQSRVYNSIGGKEEYHKMKTLLCKKKGIQLIHLWEDDLVFNYNLCLELIVSKCRLHGFPDTRERVFARKCEIMQVSTEVARSFYQLNHIQGWGHGIPYALLYNNKIVAMMSMRRCSSNTCDSGLWELNRFATNCKVVGGFDRLLRHFVRDFNIKGVVSYADLAVSDGKLYEDHGFKLKEILPVDYKYVYRRRRHHKFNFRIKRFKEDPDLEYIEGLTEFQLAELNGINRIYDCGKLKYVLEC